MMEPWMWLGGFFTMVNVMILGMNLKLYTEMQKLKVLRKES